VSDISARPGDGPRTTDDPVPGLGTRDAVILSLERRNHHIDEKKQLWIGRDAAVHRPTPRERVAEPWTLFARISG
jgi:hypothetical protein